ncbi:hypothetical protein ACJRO7_015603 [Eucalyptus globulus]|uniref:Uncharacterized protein n=1 Tax=Eucalyptus globulus TaxID=34317 RepID=A0ABD3L464_EUCGL
MEWVLLLRIKDERARLRVWVAQMGIAVPLPLIGIHPIFEKERPRQLTSGAELGHSEEVGSILLQAGELPQRETWERRQRERLQGTVTWTEVMWWQKYGGRTGGRESAQVRRVA